MCKWYTYIMPTTRTRTQVTHTPEIEEALRIARTRWPNESSSALLAHLVTEGARTVAAASPTAAADRLQRINAIVGRFAGTYAPGYLDDLRADWPE